MCAPSIAVIVSTVGRPDNLRRLFESLRLQTVAPHQVVVIDQSSDDQTQQLIAEWSSTLKLRTKRSIRGLSLGRNNAIDLCLDSEFAVTPDDDCWLAPDFLERACELLEGRDEVGAFSGRVIHPDGSARMAFPSASQTITTANVWRSSIEGALVLRLAAVRSVGKFREDIGAGAQSPWQSGEGTELLLRLLANRWAVEFHPDLTVFEAPPVIEYKSLEYLDKTRRYARGTGFVLRVSNAGTATITRALAGPALRSVRNYVAGDSYGARRAFQQTLGRTEGLVGRCLRMTRQGARQKRAQ